MLITLVGFHIKWSIIMWDESKDNKVINTYDELFN